MSAGIFLIGLAALTGMVCQRAAGFGYALVAVPIFALVLGPYNGVLLSNTLSVFVNLFVLAGTWRGLYLKSLAVLVPAGLCGVVAGVVAAHTLPAAYLLIVAGLGIVAMVGRLWFAGRSTKSDTADSAAVQRSKGWRGMIGTGFLSGTLQAATGTGGPPMAIYAARVRWPLELFVPTMQVFNIIVGVFTLALKGPVPLDWQALLALLMCLAVGAWIGALVVRRIDAGRIRSFSMLLATTGGLAAFSKGVLAL